MSLGGDGAGQRHRGSFTMPSVLLDLLQCICMSGDHPREISYIPAEGKMAATTRVVLLACGSFNPITNMHLRMFELARDALHRTGRYRVIGGIVSPVNDGYGKKDLVTAKHRCEMVRLAIKSSNWIRLDTWETEQESWSETAKVLEHHKSMLDHTYNSNQDTPTKKRKLHHLSEEKDEVDYAIPTTQYSNLNEGPIQLKLLCGSDLLESFGVPGLWKDEDIEEIVCKYGLVCISRGGCNPDKFIYESDVLTRNQNNILLVTEWIQNEISSTKIRRALRRAESVKYLLQDPVIEYIKQNSLYSTNK